jgi:hypothetical protein
MWLPKSLYEAARKSDRICFYCAYGHEQVFRAGETEADKLRRERDLLKQQMARVEEEKMDLVAKAALATSEAKAAKRETARLKKRAAAGVCPCCHRTFGELARHMQTKHPEFRAEEIAA